MVARRACSQRHDFLIHRSQSTQWKGAPLTGASLSREASCTAGPRRLRLSALELAGGRYGRAAAWAYDCGLIRL